MKADKYFKVYKSVLDKLMEIKANVYIGGSLALIDHGLDLGREPEDLDVIIYNPEMAQLGFLEELKSYNIQNYSSDVIERIETNASNSPGSKTKRRENRSLFTLNHTPTGLKINFLIERKAKPENPLFYLYEDSLYQMQSIKDIIEAKRSYWYKSSTKGNYLRAKEALDFQTLKNNNFNFDFSDALEEEEPAEVKKSIHDESDDNELDGLKQSSAVDDLPF